MPSKPFKEIPTTKVTGTFTGSVVCTVAIDKFRQGVHSFGPSKGSRRSRTITVPMQNLSDTPSFPEDKFPQVAFLDGEQDTTEEYGFWHEGFLEPLTIRDEVSFSSIESPFISHTVKAYTQEIISQEIVMNDKLDVSTTAFLETGSNVTTTVTSSIFSQGNTASLVSIRVDEDPNLNKRSTAAGYDYSQVIITGSQRTPSIRALYKGQDSIAFRDRAPYQGRELFLRADSTKVNLSGTAFSFENGINAAKAETVGANNRDFVRGIDKHVELAFDYPPINRLNTDYSGKREMTFIDSAPSGIFPSFVRTPKGSAEVYGSGSLGSIYEHNRKTYVNTLPFEDNRFDTLAGSVDSKTGEYANKILKFHLTGNLDREVSDSEGPWPLNFVAVSGRRVGNSTTGSNSLRRIAFDYGIKGNGMTVYDFAGSVAALHNIDSSFHGITKGKPNWVRYTSVDDDLFPLILPGHHQIATAPTGGVVAGVSLLTDTPKLEDSASARWWRLYPMFMGERTIKFDFPFVVKRIGIDVEILAANSGAVIGESKDARHQTSTGEDIINWTFSELPAGQSDYGTKLVFTDTSGKHIVQDKQVPHATFCMYKVASNMEQIRGRNFGAGKADNVRFPIGRAIYGQDLPVIQILFTASFGLTGSGVGAHEQATYPKFDHTIGSSYSSDVLFNPNSYTGTPAEIAAQYLSGSGENTANWWVTESAKFIKDAPTEFNVTRSLGVDAADYNLIQDFSVLSKQVNFINKGESIGFAWPANTLLYGQNEFRTQYIADNKWCVPFYVRDMHIYFEGYIPREGKSVPHSLNQRLVTNAIHEDIHEIIHDEFETFTSGAYTGSILSRIAHPNDWHQGNIDFALHGYKIFDSSERYVDTGITVLTGAADLGLNKGDKFYSNETINAKSRIFDVWLDDATGPPDIKIEGGIGLIGDLFELQRTHRITGSYGNDTGYIYGLMSTGTIDNSAIYRYNKYGQFRDMLEQRKQGRFIGIRKKERLDEAEIINSTALVASSSTKDLRNFWNIHATSSSPYTDQGFISSVSSDGTYSPLGAPYKV